MATIADRIIDKCGGVAATAKLAGTSENWVYRWRMERERGGTGGEVPSKAMKRILAAAGAGECDVVPADFFEGACASD